jgi:hypothetical protein
MATVPSLFLKRGLANFAQVYAVTERTMEDLATVLLVLP